MADSVPEVKRWKPRHDIMVLMHVAGKDNNEIAAHLGILPQRVSNVLNTRRGAARVAEMRERILGSVEEEIEAKLTTLGPKAVENIRRTIVAETPASSLRAKAHQDKVSFELLSRIGFGRRDGNGNGGEGGIKLDRDMQERLVAGLEKSAEATRIYDMDVQDAVVMEKPNGDDSDSV